MIIGRFHNMITKVKKLLRSCYGYLASGFKEIDEVVYQFK